VDIPPVSRAAFGLHDGGTEHLKIHFDLAGFINSCKQLSSFFLETRSAVASFGGGFEVPFPCVDNTLRPA
jgi:hypothetical protein